MKEKLTTENAPKADHILSQGLVSNGTIYLSGQIHSQPDGTLVNGTTKEKLDCIMGNIQAILGSSGATLDDIIKVVIYVTDMAQMPELNETYSSYFNSILPVREAVCVKELPLGATIEVSVIACK